MSSPERSVARRRNCSMSYVTVRINVGMIRRSSSDGVVGSHGGGARSAGDMKSDVVAQVLHFIA